MQSTHQFNGEETFDAPREQLWQFLTDVRNVPRCLPNLKNPQFPSADSLSGKLASSFSFLHGALDLTIQMMDCVRPATAKMIVTVRGVGCKAIINGAIELTEPAPGPTLLRWQAQAQLEGLLSAVSKGLIEGAARKLIADTFQTIRTETARPIDQESQQKPIPTADPDQ